MLPEILIVKWGKQYCVCGGEREALGACVYAAT